MKILEQALNKINSINKKQKDFFITLIHGLIGIAGKRTFRNLARYMEIDEHTFSRQMAKPFDFAELNVNIVLPEINNDDVLIGCQDASFIPKSGKQTHGIDYFWNGSASKAERGLEIDVIAIVKVAEHKKESYTISAKQTRANPIPKAKREKNKISNPSRIDYYLDHVKEVALKLINLGIKYMVVDSLYAKYKYVTGLIELGLHVVSKMRKDANLRRCYNGPQKARGRKKKFEDGKVGIEDFDKSPVIKIDSEDIELRSCIAYSVSLKRLVKAVLVRKFLDKNVYGEVILFATDTELDTVKIYNFYVARFQIEFIFRDAKGFTGLTDCQSRDSRRLNYHFNASLTALNFAKIQDNNLQREQLSRHAFSMANWTRKYHVAIVINRFISMFGLGQTSIKSHPDYEAMLAFGNIRH